MQTPTTGEHALGIPEETKQDLARRLARIRGQIEGIGRMVDEERYCPEILQQCAAVHSALRSAEKELLASHLDRCATHAMATGGEAADQVRREIVELFQRFVR